LHEISDVTGLQLELDNKSDITHGHEISDITDLETELQDRYTKNEHIAVSNGTNDAGKPIVLNGSGQIDSSMLDVSTFYYVGPFNPSLCTDPSTGCEYPDTTGENFGAFWVVQDLTATYTFVEGDLAGKPVDNGDFMVHSVGGWSIMVGEMNPMLYYKLDGTQAITDAFAGGGQQLKDIADGTDDSDAVTVLQLNLKADLTYVDNENNAQDVNITQAQNTADTALNDVTVHVADLENPHGVTKAQLGL
jgi:hypothetical protein